MNPPLEPARAAGDAHWISAMEHALAAAQRRALPIVLDPVGAGASRLRTETALRLLERGGVTILRANASEILALAGAAKATRGVDSMHSSGCDLIPPGSATTARRGGRHPICNRARRVQHNVLYRTVQQHLETWLAQCREGHDDEWSVPEHAKANPSADLLAKLAAALGCDMDDLHAILEVSPLPDPAMPAGRRRLRNIPVQV